MLTTDDSFFVSEDRSVSAVFCFESQHVGERPTVVGVLLQDMVPFTGVDASCHVACHVSSVEFLFLLVPVRPGSLSLVFQCGHG